MSRRPTFYPDQRVDLLDFLDVVSYGTHDQQQQSAALTIPTGDPLGQVLEGFTISIHGGGSGIAVSLTGAARIILTESVDGTLINGRVCTNETGLAALVLQATDFVPPPPAGATTYDVYIRLVYDPSDTQNRVFWNATAGSEQILTVETKKTPTFELLAVEQPAPNPFPGHAAKLWEADTSAGVVTAVRNMRTWFFEGADTSNHLADLWGDGVNDRDANRAAHGIKDLFTFAQFARRQIQDILGAGAGIAAGIRSWSAVHSALPSLYGLAAEHYPAGHGDEGHHRSLHIVDPACSLMLTESGNTVVVLHGNTFAPDGEGDLFVGRSPGASVIRLVSPATGGAGLILSGPSGLADTEMGAGESASLRFGNALSSVAWDSGRDFAITALGAAHDDDRELHFTVGATSRVVLDLLGNGSGLFFGDVFAGVGIANSHFAFHTPRPWRRSVDATAFVPCTKQIAAGDSAIRFGPSGDQGIWELSSVVGVMRPSWDILEPQHADLVGAGNLADERLQAPLDWLPNYTIIPAADPSNRVWLHVSTGMAWNGNIAVAIVRRVSNIVGTIAEEVLAYALFPNTVLTAGLSARYVFAEWETTGFYAGPLQHGENQTLYLVVTPYNAGAVARFSGDIRINGVTLPFLTTYLRH